MSYVLVRKLMELAATLGGEEADLVEQAADEIDRMRQAHWDSRAINGFDNGGDPTPDAETSDFSDLIKSDWVDNKLYVVELEKIIKDAGIEYHG